ncbi:MAG: hypothetical protein ACW97Z_10065 [Candidatus Hodarchaeales archaeon]
MGTVLGPCKKCGRLMTRHHTSGLCYECRQRFSDSRQINDPDLPEPLKYE